MDETKVPAKTLNKIKVRMQDFQDALRDVQPSAMREVLVQAPNVKWEDIGGLTGVKEELAEAVEWPLKYGSSSRRAGVSRRRGSCSTARPGTGKTLIAKAVANESEANFISVRGPELHLEVGRRVGEGSEGGLPEGARGGTLRDLLRRAGCDSADAEVVGEGDNQVTERVVSQLLTEMDGLEELKGVVVLGATNRPGHHRRGPAEAREVRQDPAIPPPDKEGRRRSSRYTRRTSPSPRTSTSLKVAELTEGSTGAELAAISNAASIAAIKQYVKDHGNKAEADGGGPGDHHERL